MTDLGTLIRQSTTLNFDGFLSFCPPSRWVFQPAHLAVLVQIEAGIKPDQMIVHTSLSRDGSGPLLTSFMTTMLIEDSHATFQPGLGVTSGHVSVTYYHIRSVDGLDAERLLQLLFNFAEIVSWSSMSLLPQQSERATATSDRQDSKISSAGGSDIG